MSLVYNWQFENNAVDIISSNNGSITGTYGSTNPNQGSYYLDIESTIQCSAIGEVLSRNPTRTYFNFYVRLNGLEESTSKIFYSDDGNGGLEGISLDITAITTQITIRDTNDNTCIWNFNNSYNLGSSFSWHNFKILYDSVTTNVADRIQLVIDDVLENYISFANTNNTTLDLVKNDLYFYIGSLTSNYQIDNFKIFGSPMIVDISTDQSTIYISGSDLSNGNSPQVYLDDVDYTSYIVSYESNLITLEITDLEPENIVFLVTIGTEDSNEFSSALVDWSNCASYLPGDFFQKDTSCYDRDKELYTHLQMVAFNSFGVPLTYYVVDYNTSYDTIFNEDNNRTIVREFSCMSYYELPHEDYEASLFGLYELDKFHVYISKEHFAWASTYSNGVSAQFNSVSPKAGDLFRTSYNNHIYEVLLVKQQETQFLQMQHTYDLVCRLSKNTHI